MSADLEEQEDELLALLSILGSEEFVRKEPKSAGEIRVCAELPAGFTVSLKEGDALRQYEISFLPPLHLTFELPENYPSSSPPSFTLTCCWLTNTQLSALSAQLTDLYWATGGSVVLFTWVQFLREEALRLLDIHAVLELPSDAQYLEQASVNAALSQPKNNQRGLASDLTDDQSCSASDQRDLSAPSLEVEHPAALRLTPSQALLSQLLIHDATQKQRAFATTVFDCGVCFVGQLGEQCVQLPDCGHIFCKACLGQLCKLQITEGNVRGVTCPETDCPASPTPLQVRSLVGEELFSRYDRLLLQNTLDCMPDVTYCPRRSCASPVIREKSSNAAMCSACGFAFCVACEKTYHGADDCQGRKNAQRQTEKNGAHGGVDLPQSQDGMKALWDDYTSGSKQRKRLLESRYGREALQITMEGYLSEDWIMLNSKYCPHCFCRIQKNKGCNVMTCSQCRRQFCWACLARLQPMGAGKHFDEGTCSLYQYDQT